LPSGKSIPALRLAYQSRITYHVPTGGASFGAILCRADASPPVEDINRIRVRFILDDDTVVYETVLDITMPPEQVAFPVTGAKTLTIAVDQMLSGGSIYLAGAAFSSRSVSAGKGSHLLVSGAAYVNVGAGARQVAFHTYHPGEIVPLQFEFNGPSGSGKVMITVSPNQGGTPVSVSVPVKLYPVALGVMGTARWRVPTLLGPSRLDLHASVNQEQVYQRRLNIAIARSVDVSKVSDLSTFGIHISGAGFSYLTDDDVAEIWGAKWARVFLRWEVVEYVGGQYDWRRADQLVDTYLRQNMEILGVLGEGAPKWLSSTDPEAIVAFNRFVQAAVKHFTRKIRYWDAYNEVDSKHLGGVVMDKNDSTADIRMLRDEMTTIRQAQPDARIICCSTGTSWWLVYDKRLYDDGLLKLMDVISLHPYEDGPPEQKSGAFDYGEMIAALRNLEHAYGAEKPVWSTEANWLIGPAGTKGVTAPDVDAHAQSKYLVRVNLLSMAAGVPYFAHSPFFYPFHREPLLDSVASYANMTYNFGHATKARLLNLAGGVFGVAASSDCGTVIALWTSRDSARASVSGLVGLQAQDLYGNPLPLDPENIPLTGDPVYVCGSGTPNVTASHVSAASAITPLPDLWKWKKVTPQKYEQTPSGVHVTSIPTTYGRLLESPILSGSIDSCYLVSLTVRTISGGMSLVGIDPTTGKHLGSAVYLFSVNGQDKYDSELRIVTGSAKKMQVLITAANPENQSVSEVELSNPAISACPAAQVGK